MKLHLPKLLILAIVSTVTAIHAYADNINVGLYNPQTYNAFGKDWVVTDGGMPLPSLDKYTYVHKENGVEVTSITLGKGDKLGALDNNGNFIEASGAKKYEGLDLGLISGYSVSETGVATNNFKINGTLTLTENAQVKLGGEVRYAGFGNTIHEYIGIIANNVVVAGDDAYMHTHSAKIGTLSVEKGTVLLHTGKTNGNTSHILTAPQDSKQVRIASGLNVSGGFLQIATTNANKGNADDTQCITAFGELSFSGIKYNSAGEPTDASDYSTTSCQITQSAGTIQVNGKSVSVGGLNIAQEGGTMAISADDYHVIADYADSIITQTGSTSVMNLGKIITYNGYYESVMAKLNEKGKVPDINPSISITQTNGGTINTKGIDFTNQITQAASDVKSTLAQYGTGGIINLNGDYEGATFDITQSATEGKINLNGTMTADAVTQTAGTLNIGTADASGKVLTEGKMTANSVSISGTLNVEKDSTLTTGSLKLDGGTLVNKGLIDGVSATNPSMMLAAEEGISMQSESDKLLTVIGESQVINEGTINMNFLVEDGTLTLEKDSKVNGAISMTGGDIDVKGNTTVTGALTLNGGTITFTEGALLEITDGMNVTITDAVTIEVKLSDAALENVMNGGSYDLFKVNEGDTSAVTTVLNGATVSFVSTSNADNRVDAVVQQNGGAVKIETLVPEPTTATLSLLALAALAARRRRAA